MTENICSRSITIVTKLSQPKRISCGLRHVKSEFVPIFVNIKTVCYLHLKIFLCGGKANNSCAMTSSFVRGGAECSQKASWVRDEGAGVNLIRFC